MADEPQFVTGVHLPLHDFPWFDVDGGGQWEGEVDLALGSGLFTAYGLDFGRIVHFTTLVN